MDAIFLFRNAAASSAFFGGAIAPCFTRLAILAVKSEGSRVMGSSRATYEPAEGVLCD